MGRKFRVLTRTPEKSNTEVKEAEIWGHEGRNRVRKSEIKKEQKREVGGREKERARERER